QTYALPMWLCLGSSSTRFSACGTKKSRRVRCSKHCIAEAGWTGKRFSKIGHCPRESALPVSATYTNGHASTPCLICPPIWLESTKLGMAFRTAETGSPDSPVATSVGLTLRHNALLQPNLVNHDA